jgi:transcriptional regulator with XRE-family HTH domain
MIRKLRKAKGLTQKQVAERMSLTAPAVTQWENGGGIDMPNLRALAKVLDVPVKVLIDAMEATPSQKSTQQNEILQDKDTQGDDNPSVQYRTNLPWENAQMGDRAVGDAILEDILSRLRRIEGVLFKAEEPATTRSDPQKRRKV